MKKVSFFLSAIIFFTTVCNNRSSLNLSAQDSLAIYDSVVAKKARQAFTKGITDAEAQELIKNYKANRLPGLMAYDSSGKAYAMNAVSFDNTLINHIRYNTDIEGLRVYFCKHNGATPKEQEYGLIAIPTDANGENIIKDYGIFQWNKPCPPYCTKPVEEYGK